MTNDQQISAERVRQALLVVAHIIATYGETEYLPLMERLEKELEQFKQGRDPVARAHAILEAYAEADNAKPSARAPPP